MDTHLTLPQELWERTPPAVQAYIEALEARLTSMEQLEARVVTLEALAQALQAQLQQTSQHSSRPPSSDPPAHARPRRSRSQRRRGGQPGHPGQTRALLPVDAADAVSVLKPAQCRSCHAAFAGADPTPWRHQGIEMPPLQPIVTA